MISLRRFILPTLLLLCLSSRSLPALDAQSETVISGVHLVLTTIDVLGANVTFINGINTPGDMVGFYGEEASGPLSGFIYKSGTFAYFSYPGQSVTLPAGINDSGLIVGSATQTPDQRLKVVGFLYDGTTFTKLRDGNNPATYGFGINNAGMVVGAAGSLGATKGFRLLNGNYKSINFPGQYTYGFAEGINERGEVVGYTVAGPYQNGYLVKNGKFQDVDFPGAQETAALGISDSGIIVGWYNTGSAFSYAFVFKNGKYVSFGYPGARFTEAAGINKSGEIVGSYTLDFIAWHGFVTTPVTDADFERPGCCQVAIVETAP